MTMTAPALTYPELKALSPCTEDFKRVTKLMGGAKKWDGERISAKAARKAGATFEDIVWAAAALARTDKDVERRLRLWLADCAARVLYVYENYKSNDARPRDCITAARKYARGEIDEAARAAEAAGAAWAAEAAWAAGAAWAAWAAGAAGAAWAAWAAGAAWAAWAAGAAGAAERDWQFDRLIEWLSAKEPEDWPLPAKQAKKVAA